MTRLSSWVLCSKWLLPPKRFFGLFPKQFFTFVVSQSLAVFWANGCCFRKGFVEGSANYSLHLSPKLLYKSSLEGSANCALHLSPSVLLRPKLRTHTNQVRRKRPIMPLLLGYSLGLFFLPGAFLFAKPKSTVGFELPSMNYFCTEQALLFYTSAHWPPTFRYLYKNWDILGRNKPVNSQGILLQFVIFTLQIAGAQSRSVRRCYTSQRLLLGKTPLHTSSGSCFVHVASKMQCMGRLRTRSLLGECRQDLQ